MVYLMKVKEDDHHVCVPQSSQNHTCYPRGLLQSAGQDNSGKYLYRTKVGIHLVYLHHVVLSLEWATQQTHFLEEMQFCILPHLAHPQILFYLCHYFALLNLLSGLCLEFLFYQEIVNCLLYLISAFPQFFFII